MYTNAVGEADALRRSRFPESASRPQTSRTVSFVISRSWTIMGPSHGSFQPIAVHPRGPKPTGGRAGQPGRAQPVKTCVQRY
jgi:hypothetical protein